MPYPLSKPKKLALMGIFTTLNIICSWITIPSAIPFTLQTLSVFLTLLFIGWKTGTLVIMIYTLMGICGIPVFSGFSSGIPVILGPTGGFIIGFIISGLMYGLLLKLTKKDTTIIKIVQCLISLVTCYFCGLMWYMLVYNTSSGLISSFIVCVLPYIIPDFIKIILAVFIFQKVGRHI